ncbi:MAG: 4Fe-4S binding protein [Deltaproteobacteria bacterium]|nr:4Fe-4S binding protein [Deltaproteobacteria bacterium]
MAEDIYKRLRECVDQYGTGFPATASGIEIEVLRRFFTEAEARMYTLLTPDMAPADDIAKKTNQAVETVTEVLAGMKAKGLVIGLGEKETGNYYMPASFIPGFFEHNSFTMDSETAEICEKYFRGGFKQKEIFLRTVPVETSVSSSTSVAPYHDIRKIVKGKDRIMVTKCACMNQQLLLGNTIDQPHEVCFAFDDVADYWNEFGHGRYVTQEEALEILRECEKAGLVPNPSKGDTIMALCNCGKACYHLDQLRMRPRPSDDAESGYFAEVDGDLCSACETCVDRCHMDAVSIGASDAAEIDLDRCIGCGICIVTCPEEALSLRLKA